MNKIKLIFFDMDGVLVDIPDYTENGRQVGTSVCRRLTKNKSVAAELGL